MNQFALFVASFGYVGFFPIAPGTAGSLAALALFAFVRWVGLPAFEFGMIVAVLVVGIWAANGAGPRGPHGAGARWLRHHAR